MKLLKICLICLLAPHFVQGQQQVTPQSVSIKWDQSTLKQVAPHGNYARMIQLSDGSLFCVYEGRGGVVSSISNDLGNTWQTPVVIAASVPGINMNVPDILELKDHSLLASYNPRPHKINGDWDTTKHFAIVTKKSYDKGKTWQDERQIYEASYQFDDGCWEPAQIQLPSGEIQLYFSNEGVYTHSNEQNISVFRSKDNGLTWTKQPEIASFRPGHRDGMPIPIILKGKKEIAFSIEDNAGGQFKPSIIRKPTLYRKVKIISNLTINELINITRLKAAAQLLEDGDYKIYEVANLVGYSSQSHLGRNFLKQFGTTPTEYQQNKRANKVKPV